MDLKTNLIIWKYILSPAFKNIWLMIMLLNYDIYFRTIASDAIFNVKHVFRLLFLPINRKYDLINQEKSRKHAMTYNIV